MNEMQKTRREFLRLAGKGAVGVAALTAVPAILKPAHAEGTQAVTYPLTYVQVDKDAVEKRAYEAFYTHGGCCSAAFAGIVEEMGEKFGYPYNQFPGKMFANGAGGYGAATLCGSLGGACAAIGLFCDAKDARALRDQLYAWYKETKFPIYQPEMKSVTTVSGSILCSDSVGIYMKETGYAMSDPGRLARCAGVSADVAKKTVELLNIHFGFEKAPVVVAAETAPVNANEYIGVGKGFGGDVKVKVTMDGDKIANIEVLEHKETAGISDAAFKDVPAAILAAQSTEVDVASGATFTSKALIEAVNDALSQIKK